MAISRPCNACRPGSKCAARMKWGPSAMTGRRNWTTIAGCAASVKSCATAGAKTARCGSRNALAVCSTWRTDGETLRPDSGDDCGHHRGQLDSASTGGRGGERGSQRVYRDPRREGRARDRRRDGAHGSSRSPNRTAAGRRLGFPLPACVFVPRRRLRGPDWSAGLPPPDVRLTPRDPTLADLNRLREVPEPHLPIDRGDIEADAHFEIVLRDEPPVLHRAHVRLRWNRRLWQGFQQRRDEDRIDEPFELVRQFVALFRRQTKVEHDSRH